MPEIAGNLRVLSKLNIHFDNSKDILRMTVVSILDLVGVNQNLIGPTYSGGHTLDTILTLNLESIVRFLQSEAISDQYLLYINVFMIRSLSDPMESMFRYTLMLLQLHFLLQ